MCPPVLCVFTSGNHPRNVFEHDPKTDGTGEDVHRSVVYHSKRVGNRPYVIGNEE